MSVLKINAIVMLINRYCRARDFEIVVPATKFNAWPEYGIYASKETIWSMPATFLVPKASPLNACTCHE